MATENTINLTMSGSVFSGFTFKVDKNWASVSSNDEIILKMRNEVEQLINKYNLYVLKQELDKTVMHIHYRDDKTVYVCSGCQK